MALNPEYDKIQSTEIIPISVANGIECKLPLTEEEVKNLLKVQVTANLTTIECFNKEIKYSGRAIFTVLCKGEEDINKYEVGVEFSFKFECDKALEGMTVLANVSAHNVNVESLNGIVTATAVVVLKGELSKSLDVEYFSKEPSLICKEENVDFGYEILRTKKEFKIEDEFDLPYLVEKVLCHSEKAYITNCQSGIGVIIVDGEIEFNAISTLLGDSKEINSFTKKIPFRVEIDAQDALPDLYSASFVTLKNSNIKVYVVENKQKSTVSIESNIEVNSALYKNSSFTMPVDAYNTECHLEITKDTKNLFKVLGFKYVKELIRSEISFKEVENSRLICVIDDKIDDISYTILNGELKIKGILLVTCLFESENNRFSKEGIVPFEISVPVDGDYISLASCTATDLKVANSILEFCVQLSFTTYNLVSFNPITLVNEGAKKQLNDCAITVYIPTDGETLWDVSKNIGVKEQDILDFNSELQFPLCTEDRIVIYREKGK